jgi:hypothetical protein
VERHLALGALGRVRGLVGAGEGEVALHRWNGAVVPAEAAAAGDPAHEPLAEDR